MDVFLDSLPDGKNKQIRQRLKMVSSGGRIASGKENSLQLDCTKSKSPLPEGFPRAPLRDITDILRPANMLPEGELQQGHAAIGKHGQRRKKTRKECSMVIESPEYGGSGSSCGGLTLCSAAEVTKTKALLQFKVQAEERKATGTQANVPELVENEQKENLLATEANKSHARAGSKLNLGPNLKGVPSLNIDREHKKLKQSTGTKRQADSKGRESALKFR